MTFSEFIAEIEKRIGEKLSKHEKFMMEKTWNFQQARIDALMMEYCPEDITDEQWAEWERHQKPVEKK